MYCPFISKNKRQARIGSDAYLIDIERKKVISNERHEHRPTDIAKKIERQA
jgi:hypothetical protein